MRLGYTRVSRMPHGYYGWLDLVSPGARDLQKTALPGLGDWFPSCRLMLLHYEQDKGYLGIEHGSRVFSLEDVKSDYLFVEIYNELCSECVKEVETFRALFYLLETKPAWKNRIRMLGIGAGSKKRHVVRFRREKKIPFPLCADEKWELFRCLGNPVLPVSFLLKREDARRKIVMVQSGHAESGERLLQKMISVIEAEMKE